MTGPAMRASDRDRQAVAELLRRHLLAGRLELEEFEERLGRAHAARTLVELGELHADLPDLPVAPPVPVPRRRAPRVPGRIPFVERVPLATDVETAHDEAMEHLVPTMLRYGYELEDRSRDRLAFTLRRRPGWTIAVAIFAFPFGLLALMHQADERVVVEIERGRGGGSVLIAHGKAPLAVRRAFAQLRD
jgi:hypothetical protein